MRANTIRKGSIIMYNNVPHKVIDFFHNTPGKGQAVVQTKLRNLITGSQTEARFSSTQEVPEADVFKTRAVYLYFDGSFYHFMDNNSYEEIQIEEETAADIKHFLVEQSEVEITTFEGKPISVIPPQIVSLTVTETEPEMKGATASNSPKPAVTDTGYQVNVPPFIKEGDKILVNTETGEYIGRDEGKN